MALFTLISVIGLTKNHSKIIGEVDPELSRNMAGSFEVIFRDAHVCACFTDNFFLHASVVNLTSVYRQ